MAPVHPHATEVAVYPALLILTFQVHRNFLSFFGTGKIQGHPKPAGIITKEKMRCVMIVPILVVLIVLVMILVGFGYLIKYLVSL